MIYLWLLLASLACALTSFLLCGIARRLFARFRADTLGSIAPSDLPNPHPSDLQALPSSGSVLKAVDLPLVGGPAFTLAIILTCIGCGFFFHFSSEEWMLLFICLGAMSSYALLGFIEDWHKVYRKEGLSERTKFVGVFLISVAAAAFYYWLIPSGKEPYAPYTEIIPRFLFDHIPFFWLIFLILITGVFGSATSLSVDFSDGLDGLAGGLVFITALGLGTAITGLMNLIHPESLVLVILSLLCAGSVLGYLPWCWPSSWSARRGNARRRAKVYMGDSGALGLGSLLALIAVFSHQEILLLILGGAIFLEGFSALVSARFLTPIFRQRLKILSFASSTEFVPHTEFPKPFLATPMHHHFDLLGWDRGHLVYATWILGGCFSLLGLIIGLAPFSWQRYLGLILTLILVWIVWSSGTWTRYYFIGMFPPNRGRRRRLALYNGFPYEFMGIKLYHLVEIIEASEDVIETVVEERMLWKRINIYDARAILGLYCYRAGYYPSALAQWSRIPESNINLRPEIRRLLEELVNRLTLEENETQIMRRDKISRQQPVIFGDSPPSDIL